jgi:hypothetical protein
MTIMDPQNRRKFFPGGPRLFAAALLVIVTLAFLQSPGTEDVPDSWLPWLENLEESGLVQGYKDNDADYPPLASAYLLAASKVARSFGADGFLGLKASLAVFLFLTSAVFWLWTRDFLFTVLLHLSLVLNSVALGYLDIYVAPALVASLWALKEKRYTLFTILFSVACLTKHQPLILAPFFALYVFREGGARAAAIRMVAPALLITGAVVTVFGDSIPSALWKSLHHRSLSGNALNLNWVITHALHLFDPQQYGGLEDGEARYILMEGGTIKTFSRCLFWAAYSAVTALFLFRRKTFNNLIIYSLLGYLAYFTFNTGVHENHLFLAGVLSVVLCWLDRGHVYDMVVLTVMANLNLLLFYGVNGKGLGFPRVAFIDVALPAAVFNVVYFAALFRVCAARETSPGISTAPEPP